MTAEITIPAVDADLPGAADHDLWDARELIKRMGPDIRVLESTQEWIRYDTEKCVWTHEGAKAAVAKIMVEYADWATQRCNEELARHAGGNSALSANRIKQIVAWARHVNSATGKREITGYVKDLPGVAMGAAELDPPSVGKFYAENATFTLERQPYPVLSVAWACREDMTTFRGPTTYNPDADCPRWKQFIGECVMGDHLVAHYVQRVLGYMVFGFCNEQKFWTIIGEGGGGKGVLRRALTHVLGPYVGSMTAANVTEGGGKSPMGAIEQMGLRRKRICFTEEIGDKRLDRPLMRTLTGQDTISAYKVGDDYYKFTCEAGIIVAANDMFRFDATEKPDRRRFQLIPFPSVHDPDDEPDLQAKLAAEAEGILVWLLVGAEDWARNGLQTPESIVAATKKHCIDGDVMGRFIDETYTVLAPGEPTPPHAVTMDNGMLYMDYTGWMKTNGEGRAKSQAELTRYLTGIRKIEQVRSNSTKFWPRIVKLASLPPPVSS